MENTAIAPQKNAFVLTAIDSLNSIGVNNPSIREIKAYINGLKNAEKIKKQ